MMKESQSRLGAICFALVLCAGAAEALPAQSAERPAATRGGNKLRTETRAQRNVLGLAELQDIEPRASAWDVVQRLRPEFLTRRTRSSITDPNGALPEVYLDGQRLGQLSTLEGIPVSLIAEIRYLRASEAAEVLNSRHAGGVILVTSRRY